jgi:hypothetical protein
MEPVPLDSLRSLKNYPAHGLTIYHLPQPDQSYCIGCDTAEGNPNSDDSALTVVDELTGEEVASLTGKHEPAVFGSIIASVAKFYNNAAVLVERNNHGHAVLLWLKDNAPRITRLQGSDKKDGWLDNSKGKVLLYNAITEACRTSTTVVHSFETYMQLASIESSSLRAPKGDNDDRADSFALAILATTLPKNALRIRSL